MTEQLVDKLVRALEMLQSGQLASAREHLTTAIQDDWRLPGSCDVLYHLGIVARAVGDLHQEEVCYILAHHLRSTAVSKDVAFNTLVNLTRTCFDLKSFDEAWQYGVVAEKERHDDLDLAANMAMLATLIEAPDRDDRLDRLRVRDAVKMTEITSTLAGDNPAFQITRGEDGSDLVRLFESTPTKFPDLSSLIRKLQQRPDCRGAARCWELLACAHEVAGREATTDWQRLNHLAGLVAAAGKSTSAATESEQALATRMDSARKAALVDLERLLEKRTDAPSLEPESELTSELRALLFGLERAGLAERQCAVAGLRTSSSKANTKTEAHEVRFALASALSLLAFAEVEEARKRRAPPDARSSEEAVDLLQKLHEDPGKPLVDAIARRFTVSGFDETLAHALSELAFCKQLVGSFDEAERAMRRAVECSPQSPKLRCNLAHALLRKERASRRDSARCMEIVDQLEQAQRFGPYASIQGILDEVLALPELPAPVVARGRALQRAVQLGLSPSDIEPRTLTRSDGTGESRSLGARVVLDLGRRRPSLFLPEGWTFSPVRRGYEFRGPSELDLMMVTAGPEDAPHSTAETLERDAHATASMHGDTIVDVGRVTVQGLAHASTRVIVRQSYGASLRRQFFLSFPGLGNFYIVTGTLAVGQGDDAEEGVRDQLFHKVVGTFDPGSEERKAVEVRDAPRPWWKLW